MKFLTPENLDLIALIKNRLSDEHAKKLLLKKFGTKRLKGRYVHLRKLVVIVSKICWGTIFLQKKNNYHKYETLVPLNESKLRDAAGCYCGKRDENNLSLPRCFEILEELGVVELNGHYQPDEFPKSARFTPTYRDAKIVENSIPIKAPTKIQLRACSNAFSGHRHDEKLTRENRLERWLYGCLLRLRFDPSVYPYIAKFRWGRPSAQLLWESVAAGIDSTAKDSAIGWHFSRDRSGRLNSTITNLKSELRPFLRLDGFPLLEIDQHACHPFLFLSFYGKGEAEQAEARKYHSLWNEGDFYLNFARLAGVDVNRLEIKESFLKTHYSKGLRNLPRDVKKSVAKKILETMQDRFPILAQRIQELKVDDYRNFAHILHEKEASIFIDTIAAEFMQREIPIVTIHDAVLCLGKDLEAVKEVIAGKLTEAVGFSPTLRTKCVPLEQPDEALSDRRKRRTSVPVQRASPGLLVLRSIAT